MEQIGVFTSAKTEIRRQMCARLLSNVCGEFRQYMKDDSGYAFSIIHSFAFVKSFFYFVCRKFVCHLYKKHIDFSFCPVYYVT